MPTGTQVINGVEYVYEYNSTWNASKKYGTHKRNYIGKNVKGEFVPSKRYQLQLELQEIAKVQSGPTAAEKSSRSFFGGTYLFDAIGEKLGITQDLQKCFPENWEQILSIAYYLIMEDRNPLSRFPKWAVTHTHPFGGNIPSQRSSELFASIGENAKQDFFRLQTERRLEKEYLVYDTTSISSYSKSLKQVKYGYNKDHDPLPQINLALLFGEETRMPVYYRKLAGHIADVKTVRNLLADIEFLKLDKVNLVMDRGFYSEENINALYQKQYKFIIAAKTSLKFVQEKLDEVRDTLVSRPHYSSKYRLYFTSSVEEWSYTEPTQKQNCELETGAKKMYLHIFYNDQRAVDDKTNFNDMLDLLEYELRTDKRKPEHEKHYARYYHVQKTAVSGIVLTPKQEAMDAAEKNYGYFALISNGVKDPLEALEKYRTKDLIEKAFGNLKERLNMRRTSVSSPENLEGKLFIQFVALIYLSYIKKEMSDHSLFRKYTMQELLDELDIIERYEHPGQKYYLGEITKKQQELYALLDIDVPT
jgi:transposase